MTDTQCTCGFLSGSTAVGSKPCPVHKVTDMQAAVLAWHEHEAREAFNPEILEAFLAQFFSPSAPSGSAEQEPKLCSKCGGEEGHLIHHAGKGFMNAHKFEPEGRAESAKDAVCDQYGFGTTPERPVVSASPAPQENSNANERTRTSRQMGGFGQQQATFAQIKTKIEAGEAGQYEAAILWQEVERLAAAQPVAAKSAEGGRDCARNHSYIAAY